MANLDENILAYEKEQTELEKTHMGKWIMFHNGKMIAAFDSFEAALSEGEKRFGDNPFLIREVGSRPVPVPMSVAMGGEASV